MPKPYNDHETHKTRETIALIAALPMSISFLIELKLFINGDLIFSI